MRVLVTGATGLIGTKLVQALRARGDEVVVLSRHPDGAAEPLADGAGRPEVVAWPDPTTGPPPDDALAGVRAVVNLLGEPISQRWSDSVKQRVRDSRVLGTRNLVAAISARPEAERPAVLVSQSATGYYGPRGDEPLDESAAPGADFLAGVVVAWEAEARAAQSAGLRVALTRTGVVLTSQGGALGKMLPPFKAGIGGPVAGGRQYLPWVHVDDVVGGILFSLDDGRVQGPVNVTAPGPVTNRAFAKSLGHVLHRPAIAPVPKLALQLLYGEMAILVVTGQRAVPKRLQDLGYSFRQPELEPALADLLGG
jgi:uncharacterized protein (TIGR01777 family)